MIEPAQELALLREEAERVRAARPGVRIQWSDDFRKRAAALMVQGLSSQEVALELGVNNGTAAEWRKRGGGESGFTELKVFKKTQSSVTLTTRCGHTMILPSALARQWLQEGVL